VDGTKDDRDNFWSARQTEAKAKIASLIGKKVTVKNNNNRGGSNYERTVVESESIDADEFKAEYENIGAHSLDWEGKGLNLMDVLLRLWPSDWRDQLSQLNKMLLADMRRTSRSNFRMAVKEITEEEFWIFIALLLAACPYGKGGGGWLWSKSTQGIVSPPDFGN
jgi:hypothetical protein